MLIGAKDTIVIQKRHDMKRNFDDAVEGIPRWGRRVSDHDRDVLIQALADFEVLYAAVFEVVNHESATQALRDKL